jgi:predicted nuclease of predicted toxin-antitoxin system
MKILVDMNLSPDWVTAFAVQNIKSIHWSNVGDPKAQDREIIQYARTNGYIVFTHDLDFGTILALTHAEGPSVIQVRSQNILPAHLADTVVSIVRDNQSILDKGALIVVDEMRARIRILPLEKN